MTMIRGVKELNDYDSEDDELKHKKVIISKEFIEDYQYLKQELESIMNKITLKIDSTKYRTKLGEKEFKNKIYNFLSNVSNNLMKSYRENVKYEQNLKYKKNYIKFTEDNPWLVEQKQYYHKMYKNIEQKGEKVEVQKAVIELALNKPENLIVFNEETREKINLEDGLPTLPLQDYKRRMANIKKREEEYAVMYKKLSQMQYVTFTRANELTQYKNHIKIRRQQNINEKSSAALSNNSFSRQVKFKI